jgi:hypothetical protein
MVRREASNGLVVIGTAAKCGSFCQDAHSPREHGVGLGTDLDRLTA